MDTTWDWVKRARDAEDPAACLTAGELAAQQPYEWLDLGEAWLELDAPNPEAGRRCLEKVVAGAGDYLRLYCTSARLAAERLEDPEWARQILAAAEQHLEAGERARPRAWSELGAGYHAALEDDRAVRRCLEKARAAASEVADWCDLAQAHADLLGDAEGAAALLERAATCALATEDARGYWDIALRWHHDLDDSARARGALEEGTARAQDARTAATLATAWKSLFDDLGGVRRALSRGELAATTVEDWLEVAEGYYDGGEDNRMVAWDAEAVRRCLEGAARRTRSPEERERVAQGFRHWLAEYARADLLAPFGYAPEEVAVRARRLDGWDGRHPRKLFFSFRDRVDEAALDRIAQADYGMAWVKHRRALADIHGSGRLPLPLEWHPLEVLSLTRFGAGAEVDHAARGFACTVLALDLALPGNRQAGSLSDILAALLESAWACGASAGLEQHLAWLVECVPDEAEALWPMLALALACGRQAPDDPRLPALLERLVALEAVQAHPLPEAGWMFRTTHHNLHAALWRALARSTGRTPALASRLG